MKLNIAINIRVSRIVKYFILVDLVLFSGWALIEPIFSLFIVQNVRGATIVTVGISAAIYWFLKSVLQLPIARYLDKRKGERDDFIALIVGLFVAALSALSFALVRESWQLYLAQVIHATGFALYVASWPAIFSRHLDKKNISFDWAIDSTAVGIGASVAGLLGGIIANASGFLAVFVLGAALSTIAAIILLMVPDLILPGPTSVGSARQDHTPINIGQ